MIAASSRKSGQLTLLAGVALLIASGPASAQVNKAALAGPVTVEECVTIALANNEILAEAEADVQAAEGSYRVARSGLLPSLSGSLSWQRSYPAREVSVGVFRELKYGGSLGVNANQTIFSLPTIASTSSSHRSLKAAREDLRTSRDDIEVTAREQFYTLLAAMKSADVESRAVKLTEEQLNRAETLFRLGSVARTDVLQAQVNLAEAEQAATNAINSVAIEHGNLALVMGLDPREEFVIDSTLALLPGEPTGTLDEWVARARESRSDLRAAKYRVEGAALSVTAARGQRLPSIGANWNYGRSSSSDDEFLRDALYSTNWTFALGLNLDLFDGFSTSGQIQSAIAARRRNQEAYDRLDKEIVLQVREAYLSIANETENVAAAETSVSLAAENLRLQQALYESGAGTLLEWDNARQDLRRAQLTLIQAQINLLLANVRFERSLGE